MYPSGCVVASRAVLGRPGARFGVRAQNWHRSGWVVVTPQPEQTCGLVILASMVVGDGVAVPPMLGVRLVVRNPPADAGAVLRGLDGDDV